MSNIPSANNKIQIESTQYLKPTSESLMQTMGGSINYALDQVASNASAISTETTNRINGDNALDARLDALEWLEPTTQYVTTTSTSLSAGNSVVNIVLINNAENVVTILIEPDNPNSTDGFFAVYANDTDLGGVVFLHKTMAELESFYDATGINGGAGVTIYASLGTSTPSSTPFPNGTSIRIRSWDTSTPLQIRAVKRAWKYKNDA